MARKGSLRDTHLIGHELDERNVVGVETCRSKLLGGESSDTVVEQIAEEVSSDRDTRSCSRYSQLNPLLVQPEEERLVVDWTDVSSHVDISARSTHNQSSRRRRGECRWL